MIRFRNLPAYSKYLECPICIEIFKSPCSTDTCLHSFCKICISGLNKCPTCRCSFNAVYEDFLVEDIINSLEVVCDKQKCPWSGILSCLKSHQENCKIENAEGFNSIEHMTEYEDVNFIKLNTKISLRERLKQKGLKVTATNLKVKVLSSLKKEPIEKDVKSYDEDDIFQDILKS